MKKKITDIITIFFTLLLSIFATASFARAEAPLLHQPKKLHFTMRLGEPLAFSWSAVSGAVRYDIFRAEKKEGPYKKIGSTKQKIYMDNYLTPFKPLRDKKYSVTVRDEQGKVVPAKDPLWYDPKGMYNISTLLPEGVTYEIYETDAKGNRTRLIEKTKKSGAWMPKKVREKLLKYFYYKIVAKDASGKVSSDNEIHEIKVEYVFESWNRELQAR